MFDLFAKLLSSVATFLFPVFASYKALKTSDPALLTPWLMYWVVLACCLLVESWTDWFLVWVPFYAWIRAGFLLYLILPQTQGARILYQQRVDPFLRQNERAIDDFIASAHERAKSAGLLYLTQGIELIRQHVFGLPPRKPCPPPPPPSSAGHSYTQSLMARFNMPAMPSFPTSGASGVSAAGIDFNALLSSAYNAATARGSTTQARGLSASETIIPSDLQGPEERMSFITASRDRLAFLMAALDTEARNISSTSRSGAIDAEEDAGLGGAGHTKTRRVSSLSGLSKSRSEADFEKIERDAGSEDNEARAEQPRSPGGKWLPWAWHATQKVAESIKDLDQGGAHEGRSSGVDM